MMLDITQIDKIVEDNRDEAIKFLAEAIQIPSETGNEWEISQYFKKKFNEMELEIQEIALDEKRPNLIATWNGGEGKTFIFNGHYDVFPPNEDPGLYGPWSGKIVDGYMYGRGTVDMKSGLCGAVMAVDLLKRYGYQPNGHIILSCDSDEEVGGKYGIEHILSLEGDLLKADFGLSLEPSRSNIMVSGSGGIFLKITYKGESWYSGEARNEMHSIQKAILAIGKLEQLDKKLRAEKYYEPFKSSALLTITQMEAGKMMNLTASSCSFVLDRRLIPGETVTEAKAEICRELDSLKEFYVDMDYEMEVLTCMPPMDIAEDDPVVLAALEAHKELYKEDGEIYRRLGGSDNHKIIEKYGCSIPILGPGMDFDECNTPNEKVSVQEYLDAIKMYMAIVIKMLG